MATGSAMIAATVSGPSRSISASVSASNSFHQASRSRPGPSPPGNGAGACRKLGASGPKPFLNACTPVAAEAAMVEP